MLIGWKIVSALPFHRSLSDACSHRYRYSSFFMDFIFSFIHKPPAYRRAITGARNSGETHGLCYRIAIAVASSAYSNIELEQVRRSPITFKMLADPRCPWQVLWCKLNNKVQIIALPSNRVISFGETALFLAFALEVLLLAPNCVLPAEKFSVVRSQHTKSRQVGCLLAQKFWGYRLRPFRLKCWFFKFKNGRKRSKKAYFCLSA